VAAGGTHELLRLDTSALPWTQISGSEVMDRSLAADPGRFRRLELGGRPLGVATTADRLRVFVANALLDSVQEVDPVGPELIDSIPLDRGETPTADEQLVRRGEAIFHDATRSLDQWYSCHTCHWEGGGNTVTFDTLNDGSVGSYKTVLPLWHLADTGPWTWHGWQEELFAAVKKSMIDTMQAPEPSDADVAALTAFLTSLEAPPSPFRETDGSLSAAAERGRTLFGSQRAGCSDCHRAPLYTSPGLHDVGLGRKGDRYPSYSPPSLLAGFRKTRWLHNAKARSLHDLLTGPHAPEKITGQPPLTDAEVDDLVAWLKSL
jgi:mono/diheme cytochrome c family protein